MYHESTRCKSILFYTNEHDKIEKIVLFLKILACFITHRNFGIADMLRNEKLNPIVTELSIRGRNRNNSLVFITQSYFDVPKNIILNSTHYFIMKIPNK